MKTIFLLAIIGCLCGQDVADPLAGIRAEKDMERRYIKAFDFAAGQMTVARQKYETGLLEDFRSSLILVEKSVRLCDETVRSTGKDPAKNPKHFKRAEQKIREIIRKLSGLETAVSVEDRDVVRKVRQNLQQLQEELVTDIVGRRK